MDKNTTDKTVVDPADAQKQITNPDYVQPQTIQDPNDATKQIANPEYITPVQKPAPDELDLNAAPDKNTALTPITTGNQAVDDIGKLLVERKVENAADIIKEFADTGEVSISTQAALVESLGDSVATLVLSKLTGEATRLKEEQTTKTTATLQYAADKFGAEDPVKTWEEIQTFVRNPENGVSEEDRNTLTGMIKTGGLTAQLAINQIYEIYAKAAGTTIESDLLMGDAQTNTTFKPLGRKEYLATRREAVNKYGEGSSQVKELETRRTQSLNAGH